jgi:hypothetical protein
MESVLVGLVLAGNISFTFAVIIIVVLDLCRDTHRNENKEQQLDEMNQEPTTVNVREEWGN